MRQQPDIIALVNLLHKCGSADAAEVLDFINARKDDPVFMRRASMMKQLFALKPSAQAAGRRIAASQAAANAGSSGRRGKAARRQEP